MKVSMEEKINTVWREKVDARIGAIVAKTGISPNALTIIGVLVSIAAALIIAIWAIWGLFVGAFVVLFAAIFDILDGEVAKITNKVSKFGAFLDDISDRIGEFLYFSAILWLQTNFTGFLVVFLAGMSSFLVSYFNASAGRWGFKLSSGKVTGRPGRIVLLFILMLISPWWPISQTLWTLIALNIYTLVERGIEVKKQSV